SPAPSGQEGGAEPYQSYIGSLAEGSLVLPHRKQLGVPGLVPLPERKAPPKRGQEHLRKEGLWSSAAGQFPSAEIGSTKKSLRADGHARRLDRCQDASRANTEAAATCYHFATQLDGTRRNRLVRRRGYWRVLGPKTLTRRHAAGRGDMARIEAHIPAQD